MVKRSIIKKLLDTSQVIINRSYKRKGLSDNVLDLQVKLNSLRTKYNIPDTKEISDEEEFVQ